MGSLTREYNPPITGRSRQTELAMGGGLPQQFTPPTLTQILDAPVCMYVDIVLVMSIVGTNPPWYPVANGKLLQCCANV